ncbi:hypothetical protein E2C01_037377 [Portunus trituberculatus]|uniref:Uncharacterized protein n=1 Tax=Portunus trituberculatus TaxID=210409 RepID=A0A5B7FDZ9_PORTR|nr:hypothetical protein [Portunus trituberculatus]
MRLLWKALVEGNLHPYSDLGMTSREPGSHEVADLAHETSSSGLSREKDSPPQVPPTAISCSGSSRGKGNHLLGLQWERALAAVDGVPRPMRISCFKKRPHDTNVCPRQS